MSRTGYERTLDRMTLLRCGIPVSVEFRQRGRVNQSGDCVLVEQLEKVSQRRREHVGILPPNEQIRVE